MMKANLASDQKRSLSMLASSLTVAPTLGESPLCSRSAGVRWKACNSTLMAVYSLLLQLAAALSAHHECRIVLLSAQLLGEFSLLPEVLMSSFLRARARWMRLL